LLSTKTVTFVPNRPMAPTSFVNQLMGAFAGNQNRTPALIAGRCPAIDQKPIERYAKRTMKRALAATRKRYAHKLANASGTKIQNEARTEIQNEGATTKRLLLKTLHRFTYFPSGGDVPEWLWSGLQNRLPRFNSGRRLQENQRLSGRQIDSLKSRRFVGGPTYPTELAGAATYVRRFQRDGERTEAQDDQSGSRRTAAVGRGGQPRTDHTRHLENPGPPARHPTNSSRRARGPTPGSGKAVKGSDAPACPRRRRLARNQRLRLDGDSGTRRGRSGPRPSAASFTLLGQRCVQALHDRLPNRFA
jgi:hypothetical protein